MKLDHLKVNHEFDSIAEIEGNYLLHIVSIIIYKLKLLYFIDTAEILKWDSL